MVLLFPTGATNLKGVLFSKTKHDKRGQGTQRWEKILFGFGRVEYEVVFLSALSGNVK